MVMLTAGALVQSEAENRETRTAWGLGVPALALMVIILLVPVVVAGMPSFTNNSFGNSGFDWVGTQNYERLFTRSTYE